MKHNIRINGEVKASDDKLWFDSKHWKMEIVDD